MLSSVEKSKVEAVVNESLNRAERVWGDHGGLLDSVVAMEGYKSIAMDSKTESAQSTIPGHEFVSLENPKVENFIALMIDIRDSSKHLTQAISARTARASQFKRVYYETSALLPAIAKTIGFKNGKVTEYLGDGALALFRIADFEDYRKAIYAAHSAAKNCITDTLHIVNAELEQRYSLPPLVVGVGMAMSPALVALVGVRGEMQARALGECVYRAAKLCGGNNEIVVDKKLKTRWPKGKTPSIRFSPKNMKDIEGFLISAR